jgi:hypothetical protein
MADPYDMRSNIKGKPGSQGTLFQVKDRGLLNPQQRWPQGYTPERLNEVREQTRKVPIAAPPHMYEQPDEDTQREHGVNAFGYRERVNREIAKSTVPASHLEGLGEIHGEPEEGTHGTYWFKRRELAVDLTRPDSGKTLVHELGHHHDNMTGAVNEHLPDVAAKHAMRTWPHEGAPNMSAVHMARSTVESGVVEAVADNYMTEHYRTGGRKSAPVAEGRYEENFSRADRDSHYPGYNDVREPPKSPTEHALQQAQFQPGLFSKAQAEGHPQSALQRRLAAHADAVQNARRGQ